MKAIQILFVVLLISIWNRQTDVSCTSQFVHFVRGKYFNGFICNEDDIIQETSYVSDLQCLVSCSKQPLCTGMFIEPEAKRCLACSALFFTQNSSTVSTYYKYYEFSAYLLVTQAMDWYDAKQNCEELGGHLLILSSEKENDYIVQNVNASVNVESILIGGRGLGGQATTFKWVDGSAFADGYTNWKRGQPYPKTDKDVFVKLWKEFNYRWNDADDVASSSICEFD